MKELKCFISALWFVLWQLTYKYFLKFSFEDEKVMIIYIDSKDDLTMLTLTMMMTVNQSAFANKELKNRSEKKQYSVSAWQETCLEDSSFLFSSFSKISFIGRLFFHGSSLFQISVCCFHSLVLFFFNLPDLLGFFHVGFTLASLFYFIFRVSIFTLVPLLLDNGSC